MANIEKKPSVEQVKNLLKVKIKHSENFFRIFNVNYLKTIEDIRNNKDIAQLFKMGSFDEAVDIITKTYLQPPEKPAHRFTSEQFNNFIHKYINNEDIKSLAQQYYNNGYLKPIGAHYANQLTPLRLLQMRDKNIQGKNSHSLSLFPSLKEFYDLPNTGGDVHLEHGENYNLFNVKFPKLFHQINEISNQLCQSCKTMNDSGGTITSLMIDQYNFICMVIIGEEGFTEKNFIEH